MSTHNIQIPFLVLTARRKELFLRWALEGFQRRKRGAKDEILAALERQNNNRR